MPRAGNLQRDRCIIIAIRCHVGLEISWTILIRILNRTYTQFKISRVTGCYLSEARTRNDYHSGGIEEATGIECVWGRFHRLCSFDCFVWQGNAREQIHCSFGPVAGYSFQTIQCIFKSLKMHKNRVKNRIFTPLSIDTCKFYSHFIFLLVFRSGFHWCFITKVREEGLTLARLAREDKIASFSPV